MPRGYASASPAHLGFLLLGLSFLFGAMGRGIQETYPVFVLPLEAEFGWQRATTSSIYAASFMVVGLSGPLIGWIYDRVGPARVYAMGLLTISAAAFAASLLDVYWQIFTALGLVLGYGAAAVGMVPAGTLLSRWFRRRLNVALAVAQSAYGFGILIMAPLAQFLVEWRDWRTAYMVFAALVLALVPLLLLVPWQRAGEGHPDLRGRANTASAGTAVGGTMTLGRAMRSLTFWSIIWCFTWTGTGMYAVSLQTPAYLVSIGYDALTAAETFGLVGLLLPFGVIAFGWLSDAVGRPKAMVLAYSLSIGGMLCLYGLKFGPSPVLLMAFVVLFGGTFGSRGPALLTIAAQQFQGPHMGKIYGVITIGMGGGGGIGAWLGGVLHDASGGYMVGLGAGMASLVMASLPFLFIAGMQRR